VKNTFFLSSGTGFCEGHRLLLFLFFGRFAVLT
jgi:hypothetical protein